MKKLVVVALAVCTACMVCACGGSSASSASSAASEFAPPAVTVETAAPVDLEGLTKDDMRARIDGLEWSFPGAPAAYQYSLEGDMYQLPCKVQAFIDNGWTLEPGDGFSGFYSKFPEELPGDDEYSEFDVFLGKKTFTLSVVTDGATSLEDCSVIAVAYEPDSDDENNLDFTLASGIGADATPGMVLGVYGRPFTSSITEDDGRAYVSSLAYSETEETKRVEQAAREEERKAQAEREGKIDLPSPVAASSAPLYSIRNNSDNMRFTFNSAGTLKKIELLNSL